MIAHVAIRRTRISGEWLHAHGWVLGARVGAGLAESRADAIRKACIEALSAGASVVCIPAARDWSGAVASGATWATHNQPEYADPAAVAVAHRAASLELMRECIRRHGVPDLGMLRQRETRDVKWTAAQAVVEQLGGPETVADVIGCDPAQVVRWGRRGWPEVRIKALKRELAEIGSA